MKRSLIFAFAAMAAMTVSARQLTPQQALSRALGDKAMRAVGVGAQSAAQLAYTASDSLERPMAYVFTSGADRGYMVVSADDVAVPVLAYADSGTFDASSMPDNMRWWLEGYAREIAWAADNAGSFSVKAVAQAERAPIAPMLTTHWNQDSPYNDQCPKVSNKATMTGCVATAMAQVINYHKYPEKGIGSHSYTTATNSLSVSFNYGNTTFDWANMADMYSSSSTAAQNTAVATLMKACGVSVDMDYGTAASGASSVWVAPALVKYFGYDEAVAYRDRTWFNIHEWEELVYNDLATVGPVFYCGTTMRNEGHAFVCDGYRSDGYFHFNWGWGGMSDGYFRLTALDPTSHGIGGGSAGFNYGQGVVTGVQPPKEGSTPVYHMITYNSFRVGASTAVYDQTTPAKLTTAKSATVYFAGGFYNFSRCDITGGRLGVKMVNDASGEVSYITAERTTVGNWPTLSISSMRFSGQNTMQVKLPSTLVNGNYTISPVFRVGESEWFDITPYQPGMTDFMTMTVNGTQVTFNPPTAGKLTATIQEISPVYAGGNYKVKFSLTNAGGTEYIGPLYPAFVSGSTANMSDPYMVDLMPGETVEVDYVGAVPSAVTAGSYTFYLCTVSSSGATPVGSGKSVVVNAATTPTVG
ncbi:MAG: C10 family peptidase, partial [Muribaculaceae bacterium]|nr:C10 family peptidase [Muribaculaceae bacterium]